MVIYELFGIENDKKVIVFVRIGTQFIMVFEKIASDLSHLLPKF